ncbi:MAG: N-acetylgalactosamine-6-sulfatase [Pirellulaceae bacterium]|nr:MAG: N-acetylgalactosamine-6-sulfatase [Pirellulaceae bacterium]
MGGPNLFRNWPLIVAAISVVGWQAVYGTGRAVGTESGKPHIVLVMADDMGWGQTSYRGHPCLRTPHLDEMARSGLRFERFYAGSPVCSPTRASVLTGRSPDRCGVLNHGFALRHQEKTLAEALRQAGYVTAHFGKWHLNGFRGPGVPILASDPYHPGHFGFAYWLSVTNFFDRDPLLSRMGKFEEFQGDSSEIIVREALTYMKHQLEGDTKLFVVIWFGSPHSPFRASDEDRAAFGHLPPASAQHYGELVALDRAVGQLRTGLRELGIASDTLVVFCSDNGGLPNIEPDTVGGLRGHKATLYEGGIRVPAVIEWPRVIRPRITHFPASTMDIFPTLAQIVGLREDSMIKPLDGMSLVSLFEQELDHRPKPIGFRYRGKVALIDNQWKLLAHHLPDGPWELFDLEADPHESRNLVQHESEQFERMQKLLLSWNESVDRSFAGADYAEGRLREPDPPSRAWYESAEYRPWFEQWKERWEYRSYLERREEK